MGAFGKPLRSESSVENWIGWCGRDARCKCLLLHAFHGWEKFGNDKGLAAGKIALINDSKNAEGVQYEKTYEHFSTFQKLGLDKTEIMFYY
jgi:hypothetical protein